jgi:hypothetical protein
MSRKKNKYETTGILEEQYMSPREGGDDVPYAVLVDDNNLNFEICEMIIDRDSDSLPSDNFSEKLEKFKDKKVKITIEEI